MTERPVRPGRGTWSGSWTPSAGPAEIGRSRPAPGSRAVADIHPAVASREPTQNRGPSPGGRPPRGRDDDLAPDIAADGVDEWLTIIAADAEGTTDPARAQELRGEGQSLHFHATDPGLSGTGEWLVTRTPSGVTIQHGHGQADVAVRGPAARLLLVLTRRLAPSDPAIEVLGEQALLNHWLQHTPF